MVLTVVHPAQGNREFVAVLASQRAWLRKTKMVRIGRRAPANQARLQRDKLQVGFVPMPADLRKVEHALVDLDDAGGVQVSLKVWHFGTINLRRWPDRRRFIDRRLNRTGTSPRPFDRVCRNQGRFRKTWVD